MDEKYVTKLEFQDDVRELRTEFTEFRAEMRGDMKVLNVRMDNMERNFEKSNKVMMWVATVYAVPMLFMMYKILVGTN